MKKDKIDKIKVINIETNIAKWVAFSGLIIFFFQNDKLNYLKIFNIRIEDKRENKSIFPCCMSRKSTLGSYIKDNDNDKKSICSEILKMLKVCVDSHKHLVET